MIVGDEETSGELSPREPERERDVLAERRARREELAAGEQILVRRAEAAEAAAHALEARLADAAQDLQEVTGRLALREDELRRVSERLGARERDLRNAELEIRGRLEGLERRVSGLQDELAGEQEARRAAEREVAQLRAALMRTETLIGELRTTAQQLRAAIETSLTAAAAAAAAAVPPPPSGEVAVQPAPAGAPVSAETATPVSAPSAQLAADRLAQAGAGIWSSVPAAAQPASPAPVDEQTHRAQMADALAAAVQRLRARVEAVGELHGRQQQPAEETHGQQQQQEQEQQEQQPAEYVPAVAVQPAQRPSWLAPAIRRIAAQRDPWLAAELVRELLPVQARALKAELRYEARIAEIGPHEVSIAAGAALGRVIAGASAQRAGLVLEGPAAAFAELAAGGLGGARTGAGSLFARARRPEDLRVRRGRRHARRLLAAMAQPVALADLADAGPAVWPGLLLVALAEAIDPAWIAAPQEAVVLDFAIEGPQQATLRLRAQSGQPVQVARVDRPAAAPAPALDPAPAAAFDPAPAAAPAAASVPRPAGAAAALTPAPGDPAASAAFAASAASAASAATAADAGAARPRPPAQTPTEPVEPAATVVQCGEHAFLCMLAGRPLPPGERVLLSGSSEALGRLLSWTDRVQGVRRPGA